MAIAPAPVRAIRPRSPQVGRPLGAAPAGFILVNSTRAGGTGTGASIPIGWTVAVGDLILVTVALDSATSTSVSDTAGNTYSLAASVATNWPGAIYYTIATNGGAGITLNVTFGGSVFYGVAVMEYSAPGAISLDTTGTGSGTGTSATPSAPLALAGSGELVGLLVNVGANGLTYTPASGYAVEQSYSVGGVKDFAYEDGPSQSGSVTPALAMNSSNAWSAVAVAFKYSSGVTFVYAGDSGSGGSGTLAVPVDAGNGSIGDAGLPLWYAAELTAGADSGLSARLAGESPATAEGWLVSLTTVEYGQDLGSTSSASLGLAMAGEAGNGPDASSRASSLILGDSSGLASAGLSVAILGDSGEGLDSVPLVTQIQLGTVGLDEGSAGESWTIVIVSSIPRAYWFAPEAARLVPIDRMDPDAFEVDPYAARIMPIDRMDPDSFEVDPYAARVLKP